MYVHTMPNENKWFIFQIYSHFQKLRRKGQPNAQRNFNENICALLVTTQFRSWPESIFKIRCGMGGCVWLFEKNSDKSKTNDVDPAK